MTITATTTLSRSFKPAVIAEDLVRDLPLPSLGNAFGLLSCQPETDYEAVIARLQAAVPFPIVGGTTWALPFGDRDEEVSAGLTVINRPGLNFAISVSRPLTARESRRQMEELYRDCETKLGERPKMLLAILPIIPKLMNDIYLPHLFEAAGNLPIFGGMVSDDYEYKRAAVLAEGRAHRDRMALMALGGDIEPVFAARSELNVLSEYTPTVTEAKGHVVRRVDDMSFCDYLARHGFDPARKDLTTDWPLSLEVRGRHVPVDYLADFCDLVRLNLADGSGTLSGVIPVGAGIRMGILGKSNVVNTADDCLADILAQIKEGRARGRAYDILLCVPCVARYFAMAGDDRREGERIRAACPGDLSIFGFYGFSEICRVRLPDGGRENRILNYSIIMCAF